MIETVVWEVAPGGKLKRRRGPHHIVSLLRHLPLGGVTGPTPLGKSNATHFIPSEVKFQRLLSATEVYLKVTSSFKGNLRSVVLSFV